MRPERWQEPRTALKARGVGMPKCFKQGSDVIRSAFFKDHFSYNLENELEDKSKEGIIYVNSGEKTPKTLLYIGSGYTWYM